MNAYEFRGTAMAPVGNNKGPHLTKLAAGQR